MKLRTKPLEDWEEVVVRLLREKKVTAHEIGSQLGVSEQRVWQIHHAAQARLKDFAENGEDALSRLPTRVRRLVVQLGIASRGMTRAAIESGRLWWNEPFASIHWDGAMLPWFGGETWLVLHEWAGLPRPELRPGYLARAKLRRRKGGA
jgi:hypothetical protein